MPSRFVLTVEGRDYEGWKAGSVTRSIETIAGQFSVVVSEREPGETAARPIIPGAAISLALEDTPVIRGWVDAVEPTYDADTHEIRVTGRDRTGDLVDCSVASEPGEWKNERLENIVRQIIQPYGITLSTNVPTGEPFTRFRIEEGESVWEVIDRACRFRRVLPFSDGAGGLVIGRPGRERATVSLVQGQNILAGRDYLDLSRRYSRYTVKAQQSGGDGLGDLFSPTDMAHIIATAYDRGVLRFRPLTIVAERDATQAEAQERADWEAAVRAGRSRSATITVQGWREQPGGPLWQPGRLVYVQDPWLGLRRDMLITSVQQTLGSEGTLTRIVVFPESAFLPEPMARERVDQVAKTESADWWNN